MKRLRVGLIIGVVMLVAVLVRGEGGAPEIGVIIAPARGYIPLTAEPKVFRVEVLAADPESTKGLLIDTSVLVKVGETKKIDRTEGELRLVGTVALADESSVNYRVSLYKGGQRIASTAYAFGPKSNAIMLEPR
jgi:hypothetical protein